MKLCQLVFLLMMGKRAGKRRHRGCLIGPYEVLWLKGDECFKYAENKRMRSSRKHADLALTLGMSCCQAQHRI